MPLERVSRERGERFAVATRREEFERAHPKMACCHTREHRPRQHLFPNDRFPRGYRGERTRGRYAERRHGLADDVLAQHRAEGGASVAPARERRLARSFQLDIAAPSIHADDLPQQDRPAIAELRHETAELVPGVRKRDRLSALRQHIARENFGGSRCIELFRIRAKQLGKRAVHFDEAWLADFRRRNSSIKVVGQPRVGVVEHKHDATLPCPSHRSPDPFALAFQRRSLAAP
jgi:hypothetical protein